MKNVVARHARIIKSAEANGKIEGFHVSRKCKMDCLEMLQGKTSADKLISKYKRQYGEKHD